MTRFERRIHAAPRIHAAEVQARATDRSDHRAPGAGITAIWQPDTADLSGIDGAHDLYVSKAIHKAMISVDEHGAEAAAATGIGVGDASAPEPLRIDHPFVFAIHDAVTNSVLFIGRVEDPTL